MKRRIVDIDALLRADAARRTRRAANIGQLGTLGHRRVTDAELEKVLANDAQREINAAIDLEQVRQRKERLRKGK